MGRWSSARALVQSYLSLVPPQVLLGTAGIVLGNEPLNNVYWHPRFEINIPDDVLEELKLVLYPWLPELRTAVESIDEAGRLSPKGVLATVEEYALVLIQVHDFIHLLAFVLLLVMILVNILISPIFAGLH